MKNGSVLGVVCLLATACGGGGDTRGSTAEVTVGDEEIIPGIEAPRGETAAVRAAADDDSIAGLSRTGTAIVHDGDDATYETPLPPTASPLDDVERARADAIEAITRGEICPADVPGLEASYAAMRRGGAIVLRAEPEAIEDLRARLSRFADAQRQTRAAALREERVRGLRFREPDAEILAATRVEVVRTDDGARLELETDDDARVEALQAELEESATTLSEGRCPTALQLRG